MDEDGVKAYTDPSGRVKVVEHDDRDSPFPILTTQPINCIGIAAFSEMLRYPLTRARRGHIYLSGNVVTTAAFTSQFLAVDVRVIGFIASAPSVVFQTALSATFALAEYSWEDPKSFTALGIEVRQNINGAGSGVTTGIQVLSLSVAGTYWR